MAAVLVILTGCVIGRATHEPIVAGADAVAVTAFMDAHAEALRERLAETDATVDRERDDIILTMPGQLAFEPDRADIEPAFDVVLEAVAAVLTAYVDTQVEVGGYTDTSGSMVRNMELSLERAEAVAQRLVELGVAAARISAKGHGPLDPVADNETEAGRRLNRRVALTIRPLRRDRPSTTLQESG
ncbi:MAG: OmpA family protein [Pseudomonadales bacterium]|nr:OmpA family protein [Pseudomonadales bacterium]